MVKHEITLAAEDVSGWKRKLFPSLKGGMNILNVHSGSVLLNKSYVEELANETVSGKVAEDIPVVVANTLVMESVQAPTLRKILPVDNVSLVGKPGASVSFPRISRLTASADAGESTTRTAEAMDSGSVITITPKSIVERVDIPDEVNENAVHSWPQLAATEAGEAIARKEDLDGYVTMYKHAGTSTDKTDNGWDATSGWQTYVMDDIVTDMGTIETSSKKNATHLLLNTSLNKYFRKHSDFIDYATYGSREGAMHDKKTATDLLTSGMVGNILGMEVVTSNNITTAASGGNTDTYLIIDQKKSAIVIDKLPLTVKSMYYAKEAETVIVARKRTKVGVLYPDGIIARTDLVDPQP